MTQEQSAAVTALVRMLRDADLLIVQPEHEPPEPIPEPRSALRQRWDAALESLVPPIKRPWRDKERD